MDTQGQQARSSREAALQRRLHAIGACILLAGLFSAAVISWRAAPDGARGAIGYEIVDGKPFPIMPEDSRRYQYDMERIGGKANVLAAELDDWFGSLWRGRRLGDTLACLSIAGSLACFVLAHLLAGAPPPEDPTSGRGKRPG